MNQYFQIFELILFLKIAFKVVSSIQMEESKEFQSVVMIIETFEQELVKCDEREKEQQRKYEEVEREIEDHFAKYERALAARKHFLLNECSNHLNIQSM